MKTLLKVIQMRPPGIDYILYPVDNFAEIWRLTVEFRLMDLADGSRFSLTGWYQPPLL